MYTRNFILLICIFLLHSNTVYSQLDWWVEPIIESHDFYFNPNESIEFITLIHEDGRHGIMNVNGEIIYEAGTFRRVTIPYNSRVFYGMQDEGDGYNVVGTADGLILSDGSIRVWSPRNTDIFIVRENNEFYGLMDVTGKIVIEPKYESMRRVDPGKYLATTFDGTTIKLEVEEAFQPEFALDTFKGPGEGLEDHLISMRYGSSNPPQVLLNMQGDTVVPIGLYNGFTTCGYAPLLLVAYDPESERFGAINRKGKVIIPFIYNSITCGNSRNRILIAKKGNHYFTFNPDGSKRDSIIANQLLHTGNYPFLRKNVDEGNYLLNHDLEPVIPESFSHIRDPNRNNWIALSKDGKRGFYSFITNKYTAPRFDGMSVPIIFDVFGVKTGSKFSLFNVHTGKLLTDSIYSNIHNFAGFYLAEYPKQDTVIKDDKPIISETTHYYILNDKGEVLYGPTLNRIRTVRDGIMIEMIGRDSMVLHHFGVGKKMTFSGEIPRILKGNEVVRLSEKYYFLDDFITNENPAEYDFLSPESEQNLRIYKQGNKYGLIHNREEITKAKFDEVKRIRGGHWYSTIDVKLDGKWGVLRNPYCNCRSRWHFLPGYNR